MAKSQGCTCICSMICSVKLQSASKVVTFLPCEWLGEHDVHLREIGGPCQEDVKLTGDTKYFCFQSV